MPRPRCCRRVHAKPIASVFRPAGIPACDLGDVVVTLDELEALRLADAGGLYQEEAALRMSVSRATFGRIVESARRKVADALVHGKIIRIEGGRVHDAADPDNCPHCSAFESGKRSCPRCRAEAGAERGKR